MNELTEIKDRILARITTYTDDLEKEGVFIINKRCILEVINIIDREFAREVNTQLHTEHIIKSTIKEYLDKSHSWIPVSKGLPKSGENVLFRTKDCRVFEGRYFNYIGSDHQWYSSRDDEFEYNYYVLAWMPAESYKYESED